MVQRCRETTEQCSHRQPLFTPREQQMANVTILHWGINKQCHKGTRANACLDGDIIDGALMRIRLHNLRQTPGLHWFCQSAVTTTERLITILKTNPPPARFPLLFSSYSCNTKPPFPVCPVYLLTSPNGNLAFTFN